MFFLVFNSNNTNDNHKHGRDEPIDAIRGESSREIKAMRHDSLDRILNYTVQASSVSDKNLIQIDINTNYDEERKSISDKIFQYMNNGDMNRLAKFVSDYVCDSLTMHYCQIAETIYGKAELMMLFSLLYETYPDGIRRVVNTSVHNKLIIYDFIFTGTSVFDTPLAVSFHQVKEHEHQLKYSENSEEYITHQNILRNVAEYNPKHLGDATYSGTLLQGGGIASSETSYYPPGIAHTTSTVTSTSISSTVSTAAAAVTLPTAAPAGMLRASPIHFPTAEERSSNGSGASGGDVIVLPRSKGREALRLDATRPGSFTFGSDRRAHSLPISTATGSNTTTAGGNSSGSNHSSMTGLGGWLAQLTPTHSYNSSTTTAIATTTSTTSSSIYQRSRPQSLNSAMMATALLNKTVEVQKRRMEVTFNDYNRIVQIVISPVTQ